MDRTYGINNICATMACPEISPGSTELPPAEMHQEYPTPPPPPTATSLDGTPLPCSHPTPVATLPCRDMPHGQTERPLTHPQQPCGESDETHPDSPHQARSIPALLARPLLPTATISPWSQPRLHLSPYHPTTTPSPHPPDTNQHPTSQRTHHHKPRQKSHTTTHHHHPTIASPPYHIPTLHHNHTPCPPSLPPLSPIPSIHRHFGRC